MATDISNVRAQKDVTAADLESLSIHYQVRAGDTLHSLLGDVYALRIDQDGNRPDPAAAQRDEHPCFPEHLNEDQARRLIATVLQYNPDLTNPHRLAPGQKLVLPSSFEVARDLVAGGKLSAQQEKIIADYGHLMGDFAMALGSMFGHDDDVSPQEEKDIRAEANAQMRDFLTSKPARPAWGGELHNTTVPTLKAPATKR